MGHGHLSSDGNGSLLSQGSDWASISYIVAPDNETMSLYNLWPFQNFIILVWCSQTFSLPMSIIVIDDHCSSRGPPSVPLPREHNPIKAISSNHTHPTSYSKLHSVNIAVYSSQWCFAWPYAQFTGHGLAQPLPHEQCYNPYEHCICTPRMRFTSQCSSSPLPHGAWETPTSFPSSPPLLLFPT